jgi:hypothetical protein
VNHRRGVPYRDQGVADRLGDQGRGAARDQIRNRQGGAGNLGQKGNLGRRGNLGQKGNLGNLGQKGNLTPGLV